MFRLAKALQCQNPPIVPIRKLSSHFKFVVAGGGSGGCAVASKLVKHGEVAVIDPVDTHYYQPMWTLVGAGIKNMEDTRRPQTECIPANAHWFDTSVKEFEPDHNSVTMSNGKRITYDYLVVALGLELRFDKVKGLEESLGKNGVCSNYGPGNAEYTWETLSSVTSGELIFTYPNAPIKCAGAPQKIMYLAESQLRKAGVRDACTLTYHTALPAIFGVPKYAAALTQVAEDKGCGVLTKSSLVEVRGDEKEAVFENLDTGELTTKSFSMLHVGPPCGPLPVYADSPLADGAGWVDVDKHTLRHTRYGNVFAIGDCNSCPTGKTAAKVAAEAGVLYRNMTAVMRGEAPGREYNGYTSCPLTVGDDRLILAEFGYDLQILETFPIVNQAKPAWWSYILKRDLLGPIYFHGLVRGLWNGPGFFRKLSRFGAVQ